MLGRFSCSSKPPLRRSPLTALALPGVLGAGWPACPERREGDAAAEKPESTGGVVRHGENRHSDPVGSGAKLGDQLDGEADIKSPALAVPCRRRSECPPQALTDVGAHARQRSNQFEPARIGMRVLEGHLRDKGDYARKRPYLARLRRLGRHKPCAWGLATPLAERRDASTDL